MSYNMTTTTSNTTMDLSSAMELIATSCNDIIEKTTTDRKRKLSEIDQEKKRLEDTEEKINSIQNRMTQLNQAYQSNVSRAQLRNEIDHRVKLLNSVLSQPKFEKIGEAELNQLIEFGNCVKKTAEETKKMLGEFNEFKKQKKSHSNEVAQKKQSISNMETDISDSQGTEAILKSKQADLKEHLQAIKSIFEYCKTPNKKSSNTTTSSCATPVMNVVPSTESAFTTPIRNNVITTQLTTPIINTANINKPNTPQVSATLLSNHNNVAHIATTTSSSSNEKSVNPIDYDKMNELRLAKKMAPMPFLDILALKPSKEKLGTDLNENNAKLHRAILEENWSDFKSIYDQNKELMDSKVNGYLPLDLFFLFQPKDPEKAFEALMWFLKKNPTLTNLMQDLNALQILALSPWLNRKEVSEMLKAICSRPNGALSYKNPDEALPMHIAASYGHAHTLQAMCDRVVTGNQRRSKTQQIDINQLDNQGFGMIHYMAIDDSYTDTLKRFLSSTDLGNFKITTPSSRSTGLKTALVIAKESGNPEMTKLITDLNK